MNDENLTLEVQLLPEVIREPIPTYDTSYYDYLHPVVEVRSLGEQFIQPQSDEDGNNGSPSGRSFGSSAGKGKLKQPLAQELSYPAHSEVDHRRKLGPGFVPENKNDFEVSKVVTSGYQ